MSKSKIEWTENVWNPTTGCDKVSQGCKYCYAEIMANRLHGMGQEKYVNKFKLTIHPEELERPYKWKRSKLIFVNSMSDLFHEDVPLDFIKQVFKTMNETPQHTYQVLTKRAKRLSEVHHQLNWTQNIWMGVSIESEDVIERVDYLKKTNAKVKILSIEPLLSDLPSLNVTGIDWVIVGGESGFKPREIKEEWVQNILTKCQASKVPFFFKQWGGKNKKEAGRILNGKTYDEMPHQYSNIIISTNKKSLLYPNQNSMPNSKNSIEVEVNTSNDKPLNHIVNKTQMIKNLNSKFFIGSSIESDNIWLEELRLYGIQNLPDSLLEQISNRFNYK